MNIEALTAELSAGHPGTGAYDADAVTAANELNAVNRSRNLSSLTGDQLFAATDATEFGGLTDVKKQLWLAFCGRSEIDPFGAANVAFVQWIFGGGSDTVTGLASLRTETVSRATELGLPYIRPGHILEARA